MRFPLLALLCLIACDGVARDPGLDAELHVRNAQFVAGALPAAADGPEILALRVPHAQILPAQRNELLSGSLARGATAVLLQLEDDDGYWVVGAGAPAIEEPLLPTFGAELSFASYTRRGARRLLLSAVDAEGRVGPRQQATLQAAEAAQRAPLQVRLSWDNDADLDLHVLSADGQEVWAGNINSYKQPPPGAPAADPNAYKQGGVLDVDASANCLVDGRRAENVTWQSAPPSGRYIVRVASASLCGARFAHWRVEVWLNGERIADTRGTSLPSDTRHGAGLGAGVLASSFDVP